MWGMQRTQGMLTRTSGNLLEDSGEYDQYKIMRSSRGMFEKMLGGVFEKISGKVAKDSGKCY